MIPNERATNIRCDGMMPFTWWCANLTNFDLCSNNFYTEHSSSKYGHTKISKADKLGGAWGACAPRLFLPRPEIIHIGAQLFLPLHKIIYISATGFLVQFGASAHFVGLTATARRGVCCYTSVIKNISTIIILGSHFAPIILNSYQHYHISSLCSYTLLIVIICELSKNIYCLQHFVKI